MLREKYGLTVYICALQCSPLYELQVHFLKYIEDWFSELAYYTILIVYMIQLYFQKDIGMTCLQLYRYHYCSVWSTGTFPEMYRRLFFCTCILNYFIVYIIQIYFQKDIGLTYLQLYRYHCCSSSCLLPINEECALLLMCVFNYMCE